VLRAALVMARHNAETVPSSLTSDVAVFSEQKCSKCFDGTEGTFPWGKAGYSEAVLRLTPATQRPPVPTMQGEPSSLRDDRGVDADGCVFEVTGLP